MILVIEVKDVAVSQVRSFDNIEDAEKLFLEICRRNILNFEEYDIESILEDGWMQYDYTSSVCIYHL